jgi:hypothetical protein
MADEGVGICREEEKDVDEGGGKVGRRRMGERGVKEKEWEGKHAKIRRMRQ